MKRIVIQLVFILGLIPPSVAQKNCKEYRCMIERVDNAIKRKDYKTAFNDLEAAAGYSDSKADEVAKLRKRLFEAIEKEKDEAKKQKERAEIEAKNAKTQTNIANIEKIRADSTTRRAEKNTRAAENITNAIEKANTNPTIAAQLLRYTNQRHPDYPLAKSYYSKIMSDDKQGFYFTEFVGHKDAIVSVALSDDGSRVLTGSLDNTAKLWDVKTGKVLQSFTGDVREITSVALNADGSRVLTLSEDKSIVKLWDGDSGKLLNMFFINLETDLLGTIALSADGKRVVIAADSIAQIWNADSGELLRVFGKHKGKVLSASLSRNGKRVLTVTNDVAQTWDAETGKILDIFRGYGEKIEAAVLSPSSEQVLVISKDTLTLKGRTKVKLKSILDRDIKEHEWSNLSVSSVAFTEDIDISPYHSPSQVIALVHHNIYEKKQVELIDFETGTTKRQFSGHEGSILPIAVSADGSKLLTGDYHTAKLWNIKTDSLPSCDTCLYALKMSGLVLEPDDSTLLVKDSIRYIHKMSDLRIESDDSTLVAKDSIRYAHKIENDSMEYNLLVKIEAKHYQAKLDSLINVADSIRLSSLEIVERLNDQIENTNNTIEKYQLYSILIDTLGKRKKNNNLTIQNPLVNVHYQGAWYALLAKRYSEAQDLAQKGLLLDSKNADLQFILADALLFQGKYSEAQQWYYAEKSSFAKTDTIRELAPSTYEPKEKVIYDRSNTDIESHILFLEQNGLKHPDFEKIKAEQRDIIGELYSQIEQNQDTTQIMNLYKVLTDTLENLYKKQKSDKYLKHLIFVYGKHALMNLISKNYNLVQQIAEKGLNLDKKNEYLQFIVADALLFQGKYKEAKQRYFAEKSFYNRAETIRTFINPTTYETQMEMSTPIENHILFLEENGIKHPYLNKIGTIMNILEIGDTSSSHLIRKYESELSEIKQDSEYNTILVDILELIKDRKEDYKNILIDIYFNQSISALNVKNYTMAQKIAEKGLKLDINNNQFRFINIDIMLLQGQKKQAEKKYFAIKPTLEVRENLSKQKIDEARFGEFYTHYSKIDHFIEIEEFSDDIEKKMLAKRTNYDFSELEFSDFVNISDFSLDGYVSLYHIDRGDIVTLLYNSIQKRIDCRDTISIFQIYTTLIDTLKGRNEYNRVITAYLESAILGLLYKNFKESEAIIKRALKFSPNHIVFLRFKGHALLFQGKYDEALKVYQNYANYAPQDYYFKTKAQVLLQDFNDLEKAGITHKDIEKVKKALNNQ